MEPIAVVGIGCRFPQAQDPEAFWQLLVNGREAIAPIPHHRWQGTTFYDPDPETPGKMNVSQGGFLDQIDGFDADFFGMSGSEAEHTDPQQRLFLEVAWEALENAGINPLSLTKSQTGVFSGLCTVDYHRLLYKNYERIGAYSGTGTTMCITANRLSYLLDLQGPSIAIDAACSSSLVTVHLACQSLRCQESDLCLAGGINLILSPDSTISSSKTRLLSPQGRCKSFDADADGYARGEGCGVVVLKRLSDAIAGNDRILALIKGSAVNHNGLSNSLSAPNGLAQQAVIRQALKNAGVQPAEIDYVDAHAVGTGIGDAIEFKALQTVLGEGRQPDQPCGVGSVKTNIGHLEAAAGISALIKVILALQHKVIPPHLHLQKLNPYISVGDTFYIPEQLRPWTRKDQSRLGGVSAFGFGGTNAHVILEEAPTVTTQPVELNQSPSHLITLSAKSAPALRQLAQKQRDFLESQIQIDIADLGFTLNTGRNHFKHRLCLIAESIDQVKQQLTAFIDRHPVEGLLKGEIKGRKRPKVAWFFPDKITNYDAAASLYQNQPTFRQAITRCHQIVRLDSKEPLFCDFFTGTQGDEPKANLRNYPQGTLRNRYTLFTIEYALAQLWQSWGIKPKAVMGHGVGELVAATVAGVLELKTALELVVVPTADLDLGSIKPNPPRIPLIDPRSEASNGDMTSPEYWLFYWQQSSTAPSATLSNYQVLTMGTRAVSLASNLDHQGLFSLGEDYPASWQEMMHSLGKLYIQGIAINWSGFYRDCSPCPLALPTYPFQRKRYWFTSSILETETAEALPQLL